MKCSRTALDGVLLLEPQVFEDERGFFYESYNAQRFADASGLAPDFVQDNHSRSRRGVVRGLHYQVGDPQGKLVRVIAGSVYDVVVDLRRSSPTFGQWIGAELSGENRRQLWVPPGFAHGFVTLSEHAECLYKTAGYWSPAHERTLLWNDPALAIDWPLPCAPILSARDLAGTPLAQAEVFA
ncbi:dTDP-4-dehydrorhamnose 3,5-epimerase [Massilia sp. YIM B02443]|uniref:dTDP-4-dehydrorhamnose 3,5-epimerase n=1 Tax=Massilia sp. YIM B02443 TaxID=3050127 RepID=UPI0025B6FAAB|nr:dTDP-4-dehydrorhamnose 3,5-epimerase [Massilia sp. YIM B02443]MDN4036957.1 dTDP-4-dehydrorhamnose 3,5-epimerase [Massilia sp. YIM B02443]